MCLQPPIAATRQPANLRALLVHTKLSRKENFGNTPCGKARCQVCDHMMIDQSLNLTHSKCTIRPGRFNCDSENVTYILICSKCPEGIYVGETGTKFRLRFNNHSFSIRKNLKGFPVATHFNRPDHSLQHLKFAIIAGNFKSDDHRKTAEIKLILKLKCNVNGLNKDLSFIANHGNLLQDFTSVVKVLQKLPHKNSQPVPLNFSHTEGAGAVDPAVGNAPVKAPSVGPTHDKIPADPEPQSADPELQASIQTTPPISAQPQPPSASPAVLTSWEDQQVKALIRITKEKKDLLKVKNKKPVWKNISAELSKELGVTVSGDQCYDKFRNLKQALRKHEDCRRKTGNGQQKPFKFPDLYEIVGDDPSLQPDFTCDSEGNTSGKMEEEQASDEEAPSETPRKKMKGRNRSSLLSNEMKEMFVTSQQQLQQTLITMHNENKELLSKLIEKL
ncbi:hypothetical protein HOLleu_17605 [Holothuria leucospilota]|uniref:Myb/SANT-like DNA-binding domain-containing protein n=1 Tax=Holothuria leucospilota TaxID=206669 RepID=A0A9Q1C2S6_HOLLE|nr:hypothetical protein HOLleu_17605 [Holothuria leucospilota]